MAFGWKYTVAILLKCRGNMVVYFLALIEGVFRDEREFD